MANKMGYNLIADTKEYSRYYGNFRGVDFSSDHTQVADTRFSYLVNMYKDYRNGQGGGVETFPGFREITLKDPNNQSVKNIKDIRLVHIGRDKSPVFIILIDELDQTYNERPIAIAYLRNGEWKVAYAEENTTEVTYTQDGENIVCFEYLEKAYVVTNRGLLCIQQSNTYEYSIDKVRSAYAPTTYANIPAGDSFSGNPKQYEHEQRNLLSNCAYNTFIGDGTSTKFYPLTRCVGATGLVYGSVTKTETTQEETNQILFATNAPGRINILSLSIDDIPVQGSFYTFSISDFNISGQRTITVTFDENIPAGKTVEIKIERFSNAAGNISRDDDGYVEYFEFLTAPAEGEIVTVELEIDYEDPETLWTPEKNKILGCTIVAAYDNRIFLSGNPSYPNYIFWCGIPDDDSGIPDPTYWGELNNVPDGVGSSPIMGMFPVADTLCVLKADTIQDGVVYYHSPSIQEGNNVTPITYPSVRGLSGQGLISRNGCANFRDDPVYISAQGLDAIGQLSVRYERATEHRSSLVDAKLLQSDLSQAKLTVWNGYLILYTNDGKAFLADSRATYGNGDHNEYEWYYLEDLGAYQGQANAVRYAQIPSGLLVNGKLIYGGKEIVEADSDMLGNIAGNVAESQITDCTVGDFHFAYKAVTESSGNTQITTYYYCEYTDYVLEYVVDDTTVTTTIREQTGGTFKPATAFLADGEDLYMATEIGLFKFNFDLRNSDGSFYPYKDGVLIYARNNRAFGSGCATKMDNCGIPHLVKTTAKKSLVIKTRSEYPATMKVKVRTNQDQYKQVSRLIDRLSDSNPDFNILDFADMTFTHTPQSIFAVSEKEKKWVEKQYYIYNDEFNKNFCLFYIAYRYSVSGRYKNK